MAYRLELPKLFHKLGFICQLSLFVFCRTQRICSCSFYFSQFLLRFVQFTFLLLQFVQQHVLVSCLWCLTFQPSSRRCADLCKVEVFLVVIPLFIQTAIFNLTFFFIDGCCCAILLVLLIIIIVNISFGWCTTSLPN